MSTLLQEVASNNLLVLAELRYSRARQNTQMHCSVSFPKLHRDECEWKEGS